MPEFSNSKTINHHFHVDNNKGESGIGYDMIIGHELMVQLGLTDNFKRQLLQWDGATVHMKEQSSLIWKSDLTKCDVRDVVMQNEEPVSTQEAPGWIVKIPEITYVKADFKQVADNETHLNAEKRDLLLIFLEDFEDLFDGTLGDWATEPVELELKQYPRMFNSRHYLVPIINKETPLKELKGLVEMGVQTPVQ